MTEKKILSEKILLLRNASLFSKLREAELEIVAAYSEYYPFKKGEIVFSEGGNAGKTNCGRQEKNQSIYQAAECPA